MALKGSPFSKVTIQEIIEQIVSKNKCEKKLPTFFKTHNIYYPNRLNIEQTSSEKTALYKSNLVSGTSLIDLTGGFGVDSYYFSKKINEVTHCEINNHISKIAKYNFEVLNANNIKTVSENGIDFISKNPKKYDWIYADPSRRDSEKNKVFLLKDCEPNIPKNLDILFEKTNQILLKTAPLLDISSALNELKFVTNIHIVAVENEVKELLFILHKNSNKPIEIKTINFTKTNRQTFSFSYNNSAIASYGNVKKHLYEPNAAILKSGAFQHISAFFNVDKLHKNSHLYTSDKIVSFPGRSFLVVKCLPYQKKEIKTLQLTKANITTRNFTESVAQIRKKFNIKDGGETYIFFTTNFENKKIVILCKKIEVSIPT